MPMTLHQLHLPREVRIFRYLQPPVRVDDDVIVCDGWWDDTRTTFCRSYKFTRRWLSVFATFDRDLAPVGDPNYGFPFAFNCDMTTPHHVVDDGIYTTDLCLDVLVSADGAGCVVKDEEELRAMHAAGQFGRMWHDAALREAEWVQNLVAEGRFIAFLETAAPFPAAATDGEISAPRRLRDLNDVDFFFPPHAPRYD